MTRRGSGGHRGKFRPARQGEPRGASGARLPHRRVEAAVWRQRQDACWSSRRSVSDSVTGALACEVRSGGLGVVCGDERSAGQARSGGSAWACEDRILVSRSAGDRAWRSAGGSWLCVRWWAY